ncbi:lachesin-like [Planococcus citri]|uniref:lachesin-like n=1 Tax=Planococcus citri TaxID=170843 RepID=UPI0031F84B16
MLLKAILLELTTLLITFSKANGYEPNFIQDLNNVTVPKGKDAVFKCEVDHLGGYKVAWINADTKAILAIHDHVITNNHRLVAAHTDAYTWTLTIRAVKRDDRGYYMCQVNTDPMKSRKAFLEVVVPPDIISTGTSTDTTVVEGKSAKLECKARGVPKPSISWRREDGREIIIRSFTNDKNKTQVYEGESLYLPKVTRNEMGIYLCIAFNGVPPTVSQRVQLIVNFHPLIQVPNQLVGAPLDKPVTLQCISEAYPKPINYWEKEEKSGNNMLVHDRKKYIISENVTNDYTFRLTLKIVKVKKSDYGTYKCISKNSIGESEGVIRIHEMDPATLNTKNELDYETPNNIMVFKENEAYDEETEDDNSLPFGNKTKKLVRQEKSTSTRTDYKYFSSIIIPCIVFCLRSKIYV